MNPVEATLLGAGVSLYGYWLYHIAIAYHGLHLTPAAPAAAPTTRFLVVIPAHDEEVVIGHLLDSLFAQSYPRDLFDVYVSCDSSTDNTAAIARIKGAIVLERTDEPRTKTANLGWLLDRVPLEPYDAVAIFDADNVVAPDFLARMNSYLNANPEHEAVQGYLDVKNPNDSWVTRVYAISFAYTNRFWQLARSNANLSAILGGTAEVMRVSLLRRIGWNWNSVTDDLERTCLVVLNGGRVGYEYRAVAYDEKPTTIAASHNQRRRWVRGHYRALRRFGPLLLRHAATKRSFVAFDLLLHLLIPGRAAVVNAAMFVGPAVFTSLVVLDPSFVGPELRTFWAVLAFAGVVQMFLQSVVAPSLKNGRVTLRYVPDVASSLWYSIRWLPVLLLSARSRRTPPWERTLHTRGVPIHDMVEPRRPNVRVGLSEPQLAEDESVFDIAPCPTGRWAHVTVVGRAESPAFAMILIDRGQGFNEANTYQLGYLSSSPTALRRFVPFGNAKRAQLRFAARVPKVSVDAVEIRRASLVEVGAYAARLAISRDGALNFARFVATTLVRSGMRGLRRGLASQLAYLDGLLLYRLWDQQSHTSTETQAAVLSASTLKRRRTFSILLPITNGDLEFLRQCLDGVMRQLYTEWQLCVSVDRRCAREALPLLADLAANGRVRIVVDEFDARFDRAANRALELAGGDYVALLDPSDELTDDALLRAALFLDGGAFDVLYSDEDCVDLKGDLREPHFKPDWSPETLWSHNYVGRICFYRTSVMTSLGGLRYARADVSEHDLLLRASETTAVIGHVPRVLYHRRHRSRRPAEVDEVVHVLEAALERRQLSGRVQPYRRSPGHFSVRINPPGPTKISVIIPARDQPELLGQCLESIFSRTTYPNFDVWVLNNRSREQRTLMLLQRWQQRVGSRLNVLDCDIDFNFARLANLGVAAADGELIVLLNSDTSVVTADWLEAMAGFASLPDVGAVGAKLLYPDGTIQHAGVILVGGVAGHSHRGQVGTSTGYRGRLLGASNYSGVTAACMMVRRTVYNDVGGFDETLAVAFNDVDFCLRALTKGYRHVCLGDVVLVHHESRTRGHDESPEQQIRFRDEVSQMRRRWKALLDADPYYSPNLTRSSEDFAISPVAYTGDGPRLAQMQREQADQRASADSLVDVGRNG